MKKDVKLENTTKAFIEHLEAKNPPPLYTLSPQAARKVLEDIQSEYVEKPSVCIEQKTIQHDNKDLIITFVRPKKENKKLPVAMYFHGGGWILGSFSTHERLVSELVDKAHIAIAFVNYTPSPEAKFPQSIEEAYAATNWVAEHALELNVEIDNFTVIGDSVGGNMAIAVSLLAKERKGPKIERQILLYPVTDASFKTSSYSTFMEGPWLTKKAMEWFWEAYSPDVNQRANYLLSPLNASIEQLKNLPEALVITDENDVLRDEGGAYAHKLMEAGNTVQSVRVLGTIHDFMMLNPLANTPACKMAVQLVTSYLKNS